MNDGVALFVCKNAEAFSASLGISAIFVTFQVVCNSSLVVYEQINRDIRSGLSSMDKRTK